MPVLTRSERLATVGYDYPSREKLGFNECNLCRAGTFAIIAERDRYGLAAKTHLCTGCGLGFISPHLTVEEFADFYANWYRPLVNAFGGKVVDNESLRRNQQRYVRRLDDLLFSRFIDGGYQSVLDIGGSTGQVAGYLAKQYGLEAVVIEPNQSELDVAREAGCTCIQASWEGYDVTEDTYDMILLCRTVDHLLDIRRSLHKIRRAIRPNGLFFVDIENFPSVARRRNSVELTAKVDHVYYLSHRPMLEYLAISGFQPVAMDFARSPDTIGYLCKPIDPRPVNPDPGYATNLLNSLHRIVGPTRTSKPLSLLERGGRRVRRIFR